ncbi:hypothetical protein, partial [Methylomicrobium sp. Wu6]|uniref:hypothetical protein n=1 Tax=Methylomicrobium sp. Wu6 TaxID=3107928 RepID=UPI002DD6501B
RIIAARFLRIKTYYLCINYSKYRQRNIHNQWVVFTEQALNSFFLHWARSAVCTALRAFNKPNGVSREQPFPFRSHRRLLSGMRPSARRTPT